MELRWCFLFSFFFFLKLNATPKPNSSWFSYWQKATLNCVLYFKAFFCISFLKDFSIFDKLIHQSNCVVYVLTLLTINSLNDWWLKCSLQPAMTFYTTTTKHIKKRLKKSSCYTHKTASQPTSKHLVIGKNQNHKLKISSWLFTFISFKKSHRFFVW